MIISAMPTIGKTTLADSDPNFIDLDLKLFESVRDNAGWVESYCNVALYLESKGYTVLVSFNHKIHSYLKEKAKSYFMIGYNYNLKDYCIEKAKVRYNKDSKNNSLRTLNWLTRDFDKIISEAIKISKQHNINLILIDNPEYNLRDIIKSFEF